MLDAHRRGNLKIIRETKPRKLAIAAMVKSQSLAVHTMHVQGICLANTLTDGDFFPRYGHCMSEIDEYY